MMLRRTSFTRYLAICSLMLFALFGAANAQDLNTQMSNANKAWEAGQYDKCQALFERIVKNYGGRAPMLYGPKFGVIYYRKGLTELKLANIAKRGNNQDDAAKWFEKATESFKMCYEKFPNGAPGMAQTTNTAHKAALQRWAEASMGIGEYKKAIDLYKKFLKEREKRDKILPTPGGFYINLAICHFLMDEPKIAEGIRHFETALKNKETMKTSDSGIVAAFLALSQAVIANDDEQAMVDFLNKNRADITLEPYQMLEYIPVLLKLAGNALESKMYKAAFGLYALIPGSDDVIQDIDARVAQLGGRRGIKDGLNLIELERLKSGKAKLQKRQSDGISHDAQTLTAMAYLQDNAGNQRGVYGVLEQLEFYYPKCKKREDNLFNLVRVSSLIGEIFDTEEYGSRFLKDFPESDHCESVRRMMLSSLFFGGEYKKSLEVSSYMIDKVEPGTEQHDICLFVLGGSHFYLGNFKEAQPFLDQHVKEYPESKFVMHSEYFQGSNLTRLQYWDKAAELLDAFLEKYPEPVKNIYLPNALYDRANCHFSESEYPPALTIIERLESEFGQSVVIDMAYNMKGNIYESTAKRDEAERYYLMAIDVAEKRNNRLVAGEALSYLVGMLGQEKIDKKPNPRIKDAVPHYDKFMTTYPSSPYKPQVVVYGMPAMKAVGREDEGLENLQGVISNLAGLQNQMFLEECVNAYSKAFLEKQGNTPEMLKEFYYNFPGIDISNKRVLALLRIATIGVYESEIQKAIAEKDDVKRRRYEQDIQTLFKDLRSEFNPKDLTNFVLLKVGDNLREKTSTPKLAVPYYEELLSRDDTFGQFKARLGIADVLGYSDSIEDNKKAITQLTEVYERAKDDEATQEKALFRLVEINAKVGDWKACEERARQYLKEKHNKKAAMVSYLFAVSFDKRNMTEDALAYYGMVYSRYTGYLTISAPSVKRVMEIMWNRDLKKGAMVGKGDEAKPLTIDDRQAAYSEIGWKYIASTRRIREENKKVTDEEKALWDEVAALVKEYESSGLVKTVEELKAERTRR
ncbi:tetratricopeptide repeat protein [Verrucomicrobiaceae bacterium N1E253]|uniref:Tetratricopeptide repeat protein n=2 Tax=Oceaniferula marina TaxID=2748318 RepID=A0A851GHV3_9BACT|nr:tetratricopeptide repeat protein [Oceaniferula marina]